MAKAIATPVIPSVKKLTIDFVRNAIQSDGVEFINDFTNEDVRNLAGMLPEVKGASLAKQRAGLTSWAESKVA